MNDISICIVGSAGHMGTMFKTLWNGKLRQINELDLETGRTSLRQEQIQGALPGSDVVIFSVPINRLEDAVKSVAPYLPVNCIVSDFSSVKMLPMRVMEKYCLRPVIGSHPLFGPESMQNTQDSLLGLDSLSGLDSRFLQKELSSTEKRVALTPGARAENGHLQVIDSLFKLAGCTTFICNPEEHDQAVAVIQGLNFMSNLAYFSTAADLPELDKFITPSFKRRLRSAKSMLTDDAELFMNIARHSPQLREAMENYTNALRKAVAMDEKAIGNMLLLARNYFHPENL